MQKTILSDTPLEDPSNDKLGYAPFAYNIAQALCRVPSGECLVFALFGPWGSGKTTCVNFVENYISKQEQKENGPIIIHFNPWWFSGHDDLLLQFFKQFRSAFSKKEKFKELTKMILDFAEVLSEIPEPTGLWKVAGKLIPLLKPDLQKQAWEIKKEISEELIKQDIRLLVIIDDIDRLAIEEIRCIFKVIKAIADFPKTNYLVAFDKDIVVKSLKLVQGIPGEEYLEKIIQVPFDLPEPNKVAIRKLFFDILNVIFADTENLFNNNYFTNVFFDGIDPLLKTVRNVKRITNTLKVIYTPVKGEVNPVDLIAIETIRIFMPDLYYLIRSNPSMFTGHSDDSRYIEKIKPFHNKWLEAISEELRDNIKNLVIRIFPKLESIFGNMHYGPQWEEEWLKELRICSPSIFPVYFRFSIPEGDISNMETKAILALATNVKSFGEALINLSEQKRPDGLTRVSVFLDKLHFYIEDISFDIAKNILQSLFNVGDKLLLVEDESKGLFGIDNGIRIGRLMFRILKKYNTNYERYNVLKEIFENGEAYSLIVSEVATLGQQHGRLKAEVKPKELQLIDLQQLEELEKIALKRIKDAAESGKLINSPLLASILYRWRDWESAEEPIKWINDSDIQKIDEELVKFIVAFTTKIVSQGIGDYLPKEKWKIDHGIKIFINPSDIVDKCKLLLQNPPGWLKEKKKLAVDAFIREFELNEFKTDNESNRFNNDDKSDKN